MAVPQSFTVTVPAASVPAGPGDHGERTNPARPREDRGYIAHHQLYDQLIMLTEEDIARISRRIVLGYAPLVVGTFGSYAVSSARQGSDLDLFVVKQTSDSPWSTRPSRTAAALWRLLPCGHARFYAGGI